MRVAIQPPFAFHFPSTIGKVVAHNWLQALADVDKTNRYVVYNHCLRGRGSRMEQLFCPAAPNFERYTPPVPEKAARFLSERLDLDLLGTLLRRKGALLLHAIDADYLMPSRFPFVVTFYDMLPEVFPEWVTAAYDPVKARRRANALNALHIVANPSSTKRDIVRVYGVPEDRVTVIDLGVNTNRFRVIEDEAELADAARRFRLAKKFIMATGPFGPKKNHERLLRAYAALAARDPELGLALVGELNINHPGLAKLAEELRLDRVVFTGAVSDEDLVRLYNLASVFSHALVYEGFGLPLLEAMACGCPVVTSSSSSLPEVAGDAALIVDYREVGELARGLGAILGDAETARRLRTAGFERIRRFTWERTARETLALYERLVRRLESPGAKG